MIIAKCLFVTLYLSFSFSQLHLIAETSFQMAQNHFAQTTSVTPSVRNNDMKNFLRSNGSYSPENGCCVHICFQLRFEIKYGNTQTGHSKTICWHVVSAPEHFAVIKCRQHVIQERIQGRLGRSPP